MTKPTTYWTVFINVFIHLSHLKYIILQCIDFNNYNQVYLFTSRLNKFNTLIFTTTTVNGISEITTKLKLQEQVILNDVKALQIFERGFASAEDKAQFFADTMGKSSQQAQDYAHQIEEGAGSAAKYADSQTINASATKKLGLAFDSAAIKAKALNIAMNVGVMLAVTVAIQGLVWVYENVVKAQEKAIEKARELASEYDSLKSEAETLSNELKTIGERINELNSKPNLTFAEQSELERLKASNEELQRQLDIKQKLADLKGAEAQDAAIKVLNQNSERSIEQYSSSGNYRGYEAKNYKSVDRFEAVREQMRLLENLRVEQAELEEKLRAMSSDDVGSRDWNVLTNKLNINSEAQKKADLYIQQTTDSIIEQGKSLIDGSSDGEAYKQMISDLTKEVDSFNKKDIKTTEFDKIFNSDKFKSAREAVEKLAQSAPLTVEKFNEVAPALSQAFQDVGMSAADAVSNINASVQDLGDAADTTDKLTSNLTSLNEALANYKNATNEFEQTHWAEQANKALSELKDMAEKGAISWEEYADAANRFEDVTSNLTSKINSLIGDINTLANVQKALSKDGGISADSLNTIIGLYPQAIAYANDFAGMQNFIAQQMVALENTALTVYGSMVTANAESVNMMLNNQSGLVNALIAYYGADYQNFIKLAGDKYTAEADVVQKLSELWAKYSQRSSISIQAQITAMENAGRMGDLGADGQAILNDLKLFQDMYKSMEISFREFEATAVPAFNSVGDAAKKSGSATKDAWLEAFKSAHDELKHLLEMDLITTQEYYNRLKKLDQDYFSSKEMLAKYGDKYLDQRRSNEEELYKLVVTLYNEEKTELDRLLAYKLIAQADYINKLEEMNNRYFKKNSETWEANELSIYNLRKKYLDDYISDLESSLKKELDASNKRYESEIKALKSQREERSNYYDNLINPLQEQLSLLSKQSTEEDKLLKIEKARVELAKAQAQKTALIFRNGQFEYEADAEAVSQAQTNLTDLLNDWQEYQEKLRIEEQIERYKKAKDNAIAIIDESISRLESMKEQAAENINSQMDKLTELKESWSASLDISEDSEFYKSLLDIILSDEMSSYNSRLSELSSFVEQWNKYISKMQEPKSAGGSMSGGLSRVNATTTDKNGNKYSSAWSFSDGGVVPYTGIAMVHGSEVNPELVFNSTGIKTLGNALGLDTSNTMATAKTLNQLNSGDSSGLFNAASASMSTQDMLAAFVNGSKDLQSLIGVSGTSFSVPNSVVNGIVSRNISSVGGKGFERIVNGDTNKAIYLTIPKMELYEVQSADTLARDIVSSLPNAILQDINRR